MRFRHSFSRKTSWWLPIKIPIVDLCEFLSARDYDRAKKRYLEIEISIHLDVTPPDPDVGIFSETIEYNGNWAFPSVGNYPKYIISSIDKFFESIDVAEKYEPTLREYMDYYLDNITNN